MAATSEVGYLKLIIGPMFSGKTTELIREVRRYRSIGKNVLCINHVINKRYDRDDIVTHDKIAIDNGIVIEKLCDIFRDSDMIRRYEEADIIAIEELQFFEDAYDFMMVCVERDNKYVISCGLDGDFLRRPFGDVIRLIPFADDVLRISAFCKICADGTKAIFSKKIVTEETEETVKVGSSETYIPVCRKCYVKF